MRKTVIPVITLNQHSDYIDYYYRKILRKSDLSPFFLNGDRKCETAVLQVLFPWGRWERFMDFPFGANSHF